MSIPTISVESLADQIAAGSIVVDVREQDEWEQARIVGATLIPLGEVVARFDEIDSDGTVYVMCRSGVRSADACEYLRGRGVDAVNVAGGILAWVDADFEIERGVG